MERLVNSSVVNFVQTRRIFANRKKSVICRNPTDDDRMLEIRFLVGTNARRKLAQEAEMVALVKENGEFMPRPVVRDTEKFKQLAAAVEQASKPSSKLVEMLRANGQRYSVASR